jgi:radical SAM protein with 4Fe4S-binding SPASM domain
MTQAKPNANFYSLGGTSEPAQKTDSYIDYRKCWLEYPSKFILRDFPMHLDIEITSRCNLRCTFCDKLPLLQKNQLGEMDFELYKKIIDEGSQHQLWGVKLSYRGEPLLHRNVVDMVSYAKMKGILDIYFNTNGMLLNPSMSERLIDAGLDRISISIEGTDPVAFERERIGAKFDVIVRNIETLLAMREKKGADNPRVRIQTVYFPGLDLDAYRTFWSGKCDEVAAIDYKDESNRVKGMVHDWACPQLWQRMTIEWDGTVLPCNNDDIRIFSPGNAREKTIYECWHDEKVEGMRALHRAGQSHVVEDCDGCPWRTSQIMKLKSKLES